MDYKFIDTNATFKVNGQAFTLDIGEISVGENAEALIAACFEEKISSKELITRVREGIDKLLGHGAADNLLRNISATNEIQIRRLGMGIGTAVNRKRAEMILSAFAPEKPEVMEEPKAE